METPKHEILSRLELSALMIEWGTMWSGLIIFQLDDSRYSDKVFAITLTIVVILTNTILLICFVVQFIRAKLHERKEAARLAASKPKLNKNNFLSASFSALRRRFGEKREENMGDGGNEDRRSRMESADVLSFVNPSLGADVVNVTPELGIELTITTS